MTDGQETIAPAPEETPTSEPVNLDAQIETTTETVEAPPPDLEEIDYEGEKWSVPKKLKDAFLRQSDYTRKTQELAEQRKAHEAEQTRFKEQSEISRAHVKKIGQLNSLEDQLAEYDKVDWQKLGQDDPFRADDLFRQRTLLRERRDSLAREVQEAESQRSQEAQQAFARRYAETNETLAREIKGWNQDLAKKLVDFAKTNGATDDDIRTMAVNAHLVMLLNKAFLGDELLKKQQAAALAADKVPAKPLVQLSGANAKPGINLADADMESYVAARKKQGYGKR